MNPTDKTYQNLLRDILENGISKLDRTGTGTVSVFGRQVEFDFEDGVPLLTCRKLPYRNTLVELEGFIKGITSKQWYKERGCPYWNYWCNPKKVPYALDEDTRKRMAEEDDLGPIYGAIWRGKSEHQKIDQFEQVINELKKNPNSRRLFFTAWSPMDADQQALVPCHMSVLLNVTDDKLNLIWHQRSVDVVLGTSANMFFYAMLLQLICMETGYEEGKVIGQFGDTHIYVNHFEGVNKILERDPPKSPIISTKVTSIYDWKYTDTEVIGYDPLPVIKFPIAI